MAGLVAEAHMHLGILEGAGSLIPNPNLLIGPYLTREAVASSRIEGTQASSLDVYRFEAGEKERDEFKRVPEVANYVRASRFCLEKMGDGVPVSLELLMEAHHILLKGVRGHEAHLGRIRSVQNWIGHPNCAIKDASYVPPAVHLLDGALASLEGFIRDPPAEMPVLVQCALAHYQFEAIHPFGDGNGRVGRLMVQLMLAGSGTLAKPILCLSAYFERNKAEYYRLLRGVSENSDWTEWIKFFLNGVVQCSREAIDAMHKTLDLKAKHEQRLREDRASRNAMVLATYLFARPVLTIPMAAKRLGTGYPPAKKAVTYLVNAGILEQIGSKKRNKRYVARKIIGIFP